MPETIETGKKGEEEALAFLASQGYKILHTNWRIGHLEIDIVAQDGEFLVIIEVKTRKNADFGAPETFVTRDKQQKLVRAAQGYIRKFGIELEARFDIIAINNSTGHAEHIKRAFYPRLR